MGEDEDLDRNMYVIINKGGNWLIDSKKHYSVLDNKWIIDSL